MKNCPFHMKCFVSNNWFLIFFKWYFTKFLLIYLFSYDNVFQCILFPDEIRGECHFVQNFFWGTFCRGEVMGVHSMPILLVFLSCWFSYEKMLISYEMFFVFTFLLTFSNDISLNFLLVIFPFFIWKYVMGGTLFHDEKQVNAISYESSFWR